ncbi:hypothetical protein ACFFX0_05025 [Citricoccus parietis]|uniref:AraC family transcriptional regulator n=1 Tax=Citricoccus parietis TaxID=592307 RepID=A0ABV5FVC1_9MICC
MDLDLVLEGGVLLELHPGGLLEVAHGAGRLPFVKPGACTGGVWLVEGPWSYLRNGVPARPGCDAPSASERGGRHDRRLSPVAAA